MEVCLDIDVICHLGFVTSVDIREKGFYYIVMSLIYGSSDVEKTIISPIGCFSAPSTLNSKVKKMMVCIHRWHNFII